MLCYLDPLQNGSGFFLDPGDTFILSFLTPGPLVFSVGLQTTKKLRNQPETPLN